MSTDLDDVRSDLHDATPPGWFVGRPSYDEGRGVWEQYAFDPAEKAKVGVRSWTACSRGSARPSSRRFRFDLLLICCLRGKERPLRMTGGASFVLGIW